MQITCPNCGATGRIPDEKVKIGRRVRCPSCQTTIEIAVVSHQANTSQDIRQKEKEGISRTLQESNKVAQRNDFREKVLCSDGNCIGVIGEDGLCTVCKKPYEEDSEANEFDEKIENFERQRLKSNKLKPKNTSTKQFHS